MQLLRHGLQLLELTRLGDSLPTGEFVRELTGQSWTLCIPVLQLSGPGTVALLAQA